MKYVILPIMICICLSCSKDENSELNKNENAYKASTPILINEIKIGNQIWMARNLDVDHYRNGDQILNFQGGILTNQDVGFWCYYNNDSTNGATYGKLYNWAAVNDPRGLAPQGWHIPSKEEWNILSDYLGGTGIAGGKMKATILWNPYNANYATNSSRFTALPGGYKPYYNNLGYDKTTDGYWWTSSISPITINDNIYAYNVHIEYFPQLALETNPVNTGYSVRCIKN